MSYFLMHYCVQILAFSVLIILTLSSVIYCCRKRNKQLRNIIINRHREEINGKDYSLQSLNRQIATLNDQQERLLRENERLHSEIHHRVNNNLQTTISLLKMQSAYISNDEALKAIKNIQQRIYAISLMNKQINEVDTVSVINMQQFIEDLVSYLRGDFKEKDFIKFQLSLECLILPLIQALPLSIIINEAITNSIKYAFPNIKQGTIAVKLTKHHDTITLRITDNGVGLPKFYKDNNNTLGKNLIKGLTDQLDGELTVKNDLGTNLTVIFKSR